MIEKRKAILVTGSHRSGTTWVGNMLALDPSTHYIHEPFNVKLSRERTKLFVNWFQYINAENQHLFIDELNQLMTSNSLPLVKDPIGIFSASWLYETFNMNILVMIRHPAAFCSSLKINGWKFEFKNFLNQPLLIKNYLSKYEEQIKKYTEVEQDIISQAILLWNCITHVINIYQKKHSQWLFIKHEDISLNPVECFKKIFQSYNLNFTPTIETKILESSGSHNPQEQKSGNEFMRNSKANILNWKNRLSSSEIDLIKDKTHEISQIYYSENDW